MSNIRKHFLSFKDYITKLMDAGLYAIMNAISLSCAVMLFCEKYVFVFFTALISTFYSHHPCDGNQKIDLKS